MPESRAVRVAIYARVSTASQNPEPQVKELREFCDRRQWKIAGEYVDVASGVNQDRPQLARMMRDAARHEFDVLVVWKFDRLGRSVSHLLRALDELADLQIEFVSLTEAVDTHTPVGKMTMTVLGAVAQMERDLARERIALGMRSARARGKHMGRPIMLLDEEKVRLDYKNLRSLRSVAVLHNCSQRTIHDIVHHRRLARHVAPIAAAVAS